MTGSEAQALAALVTHGPGHVLDSLPHPLHGRLQLMPLPPGQAVLQAAGTRRLRIEWGGGQLALDLPPATLNQWLLAVLALPELDSLPEAFQPVALAHLLDQLLAPLQASGRGSAQLRDTQPAQGRPDWAPHAVQLTLTLADGNPLQALLHMDSLGLMLVGSLAQSAAPADHAPDPDELPVALELCIGQTVLPAAQLSALKVGGWVACSQSHLGAGDALLLRCALKAGQHWSLPARVDGLQLIPLSRACIMSISQTPGDDLNSHAGDDESPVSLDQMPVHLSFDLGRKTLTLAQLRQLGEGQALALDRPVQQGVTLRANGAVIGQGQLLDIDGRMGVLISSLHMPRSDADA